MKNRDFALLALFMALVCVATMIIKIPIPQTNGYMNLGDSMVLLSAMFFGPIGGFLAGGIGSALADVFGGYAQWAPWTLVIKGLEAAAAGALFPLMKAAKGKVSPGLVACYIVATAIMVSGYFIAGSIMYDQKAALAEIPANLIQAGGSIVLATLLYPVFYRIVKVNG